MDKIGKLTGSGKIRERVIKRNPNIIVDVDLYNYNVDGNMLKPEHIRYLKEKIIPRLRSARVHVKLIGQTSRTGSSEYNKTLSTERVLRVKKFLISQGFPESKVPGQEMRSLGEDFSTSKEDENELERCVTLKLAWGVKTQPIFTDIVPITIYSGGKDDVPQKKESPKPSTVPKPKGGVKWKIIHLSSLDLADVGVGVSGHLFRIVDITGNKDMVVTLAGPSLGVGFAVPVTGKGKWVHFETTRPHQIEEFVTWARFTTAPSFLNLSTSDNFLTFKGVSTKGPVRVKSGITFGVSGPSVTIGHTDQLGKTVDYKPRWTSDIITGKVELE